jgi:hypothetical protein
MRDTLELFGAWLSLVERLVRDQEAGGSNPLAPTNFNTYPEITSGHNCGHPGVPTFSNPLAEIRHGLADWIDFWCD